MKKTKPKIKVLKPRKHCCSLALSQNGSDSKNQKNKLNNHMTTIKKNPLADKKWLKEFAEGFQKDINNSKKSKKLADNWGGEINCTQEDIGEPNYPDRKKKK